MFCLIVYRAVVDHPATYRDYLGNEEPNDGHLGRRRDVDQEWITFRWRGVEQDGEISTRLPRFIHQRLPREWGTYLARLVLLH